jgi:hypothetical protein
LAGSPSSESQQSFKRWLEQRGNGGAATGKVNPI